MDCNRHLSGLRELIEQRLQFYTDYTSNIYQAPVMEAMRYSLLGGGKRVRAVLALEFCSAFGAEGENALPAACALEMVHAYSLIHDDLPCMDDDDMRRGKPTCHKQFGEALAVLAGDGLLTLAFETLSSADTVKLLGAERAVALIRALSSAAGGYGMLGGQAIDVVSGGKSLSGEAHSGMAAMKTGALIKAAVHCGCISAGVGGARAEKALDYAGLVGKAFQITDDILDVTGDSSLLGKNTGSDERESKVTFVSLYGLDGARRMADGCYAQALDILRQLLPQNEFLPWLTGLLARRSF